MLISLYRSAERGTIFNLYFFTMSIKRVPCVEFAYYAVEFSDKQIIREIVEALYNSCRIAFFQYHFFFNADAVQLRDKTKAVSDPP